MGARSSWSSLLAIGLLGLAASCEAADPVAPRPDDPDLLLWLDAEDRHSLDTDEHGLVSQWRSKATRTGGHVTAADERRPTWIADAWQGRPAVRFDGRDDVLRNEQFRQVARHWTLAIVVAPHSNSGSGVLAGYHGFFSTNAHGRQDFVTGLNVDMGGRESDRLIGVNVEGSRGGGETNLLLTGSDFGQPRVLVVWAGPDQTTLFAESARQASRPASGAVTSLEEIRVGARRYLSQGESGFVAADIAEVILYARALSNAELDELSRYLEAKHGVVRATATERRLSLDEALAALPAIQWDRSRLCLATIDDQLRGGDATARRSLEQRLAALLGKEDISDAAADAICRRLEIIGTAESVAALSHLLNNPLRSGAALRALQQIPGPEAGQVLVTALANAEPAERVALIQTLGARREQQAVEILLDALRQPDAAVAAAAAAALGSLGAPRSVSALLHSPAATPHDLLALARQLATTHGADAKRVYEHLAQHADEAVRVAAFRGLVMLEPAAARERLWEALAGDQPRLRGMAAQLLAQDCPEPLAAQIPSEFPDLPTAAQLTLLGRRWSRLPAVGGALARQALHAPATQVRCDGLRLLADVGCAADTQLLIRMATEDADPRVRSSAELTLRHLAAAGTDAALIQQMSTAAGPACQALVRAVRDRRSTGAELTLQTLCTAADPQTRIEALTAMQTLGTSASVPLLIACLGAAASDTEQTAAERALALCCLRLSGVDEPAAVLVDTYQRGEVNQRIRLLPVLGRVGGPGAEKTIRAALADQEPAVRAAAVRGLANWPDATVADQLLHLAQHADTPGQQIAALRGFIRVVTLPGARAHDQTVDMLQQAWQLATRNEERRLILQRLPAAACPEALALALEHLHNPALSADAIEAAAQLSEALLPQDPSAARAAMRQILEVCQDPAITARLSRHVSQEP